MKTLVLVPLTALSYTLVYTASKIAEYWRWGQHPTIGWTSELDLSQWRWWACCSVRQICPRNCNNKRKDEKGWNDNTKKEHGSGTFWALTWPWLYVLDFWQSGWCPSGSPHASGSEEYILVSGPRSGTNWATRRIPVLISIKCWRRWCFLQYKLQALAMVMDLAMGLKPAWIWNSCWNAWQPVFNRATSDLQ